MSYAEQERNQPHGPDGPDCEEYREALELENDLADDESLFETEEEEDAN